MFRKEHLWYFSAETIRVLLERYGFRILKIRPHGGSEICFALDKMFNIESRKVHFANFNCLKSFKSIFTNLFNRLGFNEDILIYAESTDI